MEQASNPHYLKGSKNHRVASASSQAVGVEEIPVTPINLSIPLQVSASGSGKLSDKYLELERLKKSKATKEKDSSTSHSKKNRSKKDGKVKKNKKKAKDADGTVNPLFIQSHQLIALIFLH